MHVHVSFQNKTKWTWGGAGSDRGGQGSGGNMAVLTQIASGEANDLRLALVEQRASRQAPKKSLPFHPVPKIHVFLGRSGKRN